MWRLAAMGGTLASEVIAGVIIGWLLDKLFGTAPILLIVFTVAALILGMTGFIRKASREQQAELRRRPDPLPAPLPDEPEPDDADARGTGDDR